MPRVTRQAFVDGFGAVEAATQEKLTAAGVSTDDLRSIVGPDDVVSEKQNGGKVCHAGRLSARGRALQTGSRRVEGANGTDGEDVDSGEVVAAAVAVLGRVVRDEVGRASGSGHRVPAGEEHGAVGAAGKAPAPTDGR